jgi:predicted nucleic acid-binding Zn ribbon protein
VSLPRVKCSEVEEKVCFDQAFTEEATKEAEKCSAEVTTIFKASLFVPYEFRRPTQCERICS